MIKTERINDMEFDIYKVEEIKKPFNAKDIADILNKFPNYNVFVSGDSEKVYRIYINHKTQDIDL